jgi:Luciferase-like monooxygenase
MVPAALTAASSESKRSTARVTIAPAVAGSVTLPVTGRVGLYTSVMLTPLRPVAVVASQAATVDQLSGGRLFIESRHRIAGWVVEPRLPAVFSATPLADPGPSATVGQHGDQIRAELP